MTIDASKYAGHTPGPCLATFEIREIGMSGQCLFVARRPGDPEHNPSVSIQLPTDIARWILLSNDRSLELIAELVAAREREAKLREKLEAITQAWNRLRIIASGRLVDANLILNEVRMRIEIADRERKRCHCWADAEKEASKAEADKPAEGGAL